MMYWSKHVNTIKKEFDSTMKYLSVNYSLQNHTLYLFLIIELNFFIDGPNSNKIIYTQYGSNNVDKSINSHTLLSYGINLITAVFFFLKRWFYIK